MTRIRAAIPLLRQLDRRAIPTSKVIRHSSSKVIRHNKAIRDSPVRVLRSSNSRIPPDA